MVVQDSTDHREATVFSGSCGTTPNLPQLDPRAEAPDKPAERWRQSGWDGRKYTAEDNHEAVKVGDLAPGN